MAISLGPWWHSRPGSPFPGDMVGVGYVCMVVINGLDDLNPAMENPISFCSGLRALCWLGIGKKKAFFPKSFF